MDKEVGEEQNKVPFKGPLKDTGLTSHNVIRSIDGVPDKLVRVGSTERVELEYIDNAGYSEDVLEKYRKGERLHEEVMDKYGIRSVKQNIIVGEDSDGKAKVMVVTDRVEGSDLLDALQDNEDPALVEKTSRLVDSLSQYFLDKRKDGSEMLYDLARISQFVYGRVAGEDEDQIYNVDIDPMSSIFDESDATNCLAGTIDFIRMLKEIDGLKKGVNTEVAKGRVNELLSSFPESSQYYSFANAGKSILQEE